MATEMNLISVNLKTLENFIKEQIQNGDYNPIMLLGKAGIGKTELAMGIAKELGIGFKQQRLMLSNEAELAGIPDISGERTVMKSMDSLPYADTDGEVGIFLLDEITSAKPAVRAAAYQLLDSSRGLGSYKLPDKWIAIAAGNGMEDGGVFAGMESAFMNRCKCFRVEASFESWRPWAEKNNVHPVIIAFLSKNREFLHKMDIDEIAAVFPSPRSWVKASDMLKKKEEKVGFGKVSGLDLDIIIGCSVGVEMLAHFAAFYSFVDQTLPIEDIFKGKVKPDEKDKDGKYVYAHIPEEAIYSSIAMLGTVAKSLFQKLQASGDVDTEAKYYFNAMKWFMDFSELTRKDLGIEALMALSAHVSMDAQMKVVDMDVEFVKKLNSLMLDNK